MYLYAYTIFLFINNLNYTYMVLIIMMCYLVGLVLIFLIGAMLADMDIDWKYLDLHPLYIFAWP